MELMSETSLARGEALVDYAFSGERRELSLDVPELIGVVAAYIAERGTSVDIEERLSGLLAPSIAARAARTFALFDDPDGRGLWTQGPATEDVRFTHPELDRRYPSVRQNFEGLFPENHHDDLQDRPF